MQIAAQFPLIVTHLDRKVFFTSIINKEQSFSFVINVEVQRRKFFKIYFEESAARTVFLYTAKGHHYTTRKKIKLNKHREKPTFEISNEVSVF